MSTKFLSFQTRMMEDILLNRDHIISVEAYRDAPGQSPRALITLDTGREIALDTCLYTAMDMIEGVED